MQSKVVPVSVAAKELGMITPNLYALIKKYRIKTTKIPTSGKRGRTVVKGVNISDIQSKLSKQIVPTKTAVIDKTIKSAIRENPSVLNYTVRDLLIEALRA
jgi:hypothetical protein